MQWLTQFFTRGRIYSDLWAQIQQHFAEKIEALYGEWHELRKGGLWVDSGAAGHRNRSGAAAAGVVGLTFMLSASALEGGRPPKAMACTTKVNTLRYMLYE